MTEIKGSLYQIINTVLPTLCYSLYLYIFNRSSRISGISHGLFQHRYFWNIYANHYYDSSYLCTTPIHPASIRNL